MATGFIFDKTFLEHQTGADHPESAARLQAVMRRLHGLPLYQQLVQFTAFAAPEEIVESNHSKTYLARARQTCAGGGPFLDTMDVAVSEQSYQVALTAVGAGIALAEGVLDGAIANGFALARPPGHHAEHGHAMGFCLLNNTAILARYLKARHDLHKILILDWDVHHGNGTQHSFEEDPSVLYVSIHQYPFYPGTGAHTEIGIGKGRGATLNCPMPAGSGDADYQAAFAEKILPKIDAFKPQFVILSAGFDAHADDPLGGVNLDADSFGWMTARMMEATDRHADGRLVSVLEGGYSLTALPLCVEKHLERLAGSFAP